MIITTASIFVDDQQKALDFYTSTLGFQLKTYVPAGAHRWLTVVSPQAPEGVELLLEPSEHLAVRPFKEALVADGIPFNSFGVEDVQAEYERLVGLGVRFVQEPTAMGPVTAAILDDTCGNLIMIAEMTDPEAAGQ
ncbi:bleomycin resistance protein [Kocuria rosea subsp. polaris]|uniref:Bleomycin resistance protein n=1 Tax=Kocuria rosea subsp. polaris TaxID=136273 RepID=A0A0W8I9W8_KOCRO|nr:VOC family protein [Kocuria polaris]KUG56703.1 bleomycin resistance protein [Kocuria polaris]